MGSVREKPLAMSGKEGAGAHCRNDPAGLCTNGTGRSFLDRSWKALSVKFTGDRGDPGGTHLSTRRYNSGVPQLIHHSNETIG